MSNMNITTAEGGNNPTPQQEGRTFTQDQLNAIVGERLSKERTKAEGELVQRERDIARRELQLTATDKLKGKGLSAEWMEFLDMSGAEAFEKSLEKLEGILEIGYNTYHKVKYGKTPATVVFGGAGRTPMVGGSENEQLRDAMGLKGS